MKRDLLATIAELRTSIIGADMANISEEVYQLLMKAQEVIETSNPKHNDYNEDCDPCFHG